MSVVIENEIVEFLKNNKIIKPKEIQEKFCLTLSTTRRYLISLEKKKIIKRMFGEIILNDESDNKFDLNATINLTANIDVKKMLAQVAAKLCDGYQTIYLDSGSSCYYLLDFLDKNIEIYTNSILNSNRAISLGFNNVNILGGNIKHKTLSIVDVDLDFIKKVTFPISFMGVNGISEDERLTTPEKKEGIIKKLICSRSELVVIMCEKEKLNKRTFYDFTVENKNTIIVTNSPKSENINKKFIYICKGDLKYEN